jgi:hypothetical protein
MFVGLVLFGVGAGNGLGGLLDAFTGNGSGGAQKQVVSQQEKQALQATKDNPNDPGAWAALVSARWTSANGGADVNTTTGAYTATGKQELRGVTEAWKRYAALTKQPDQTTAILAARAYAALGQYAGAANAWQAVALGSPTEPKGFMCLAGSSYAAGQTRKGDLATAKALQLLPKGLTKTQIKTELTAAKSTPSTAQQFVQQFC